MEIIQIGTIAILQKWLLFGVALLFSLTIMKIWLRQSQIEDNKIQFDLLTNTLIAGFIIWKVSLFVFEPALIWKSPFSLLYFTGGSNGLVLAILFSIIFFIYKGQRKNISSLMLIQTEFVFSFVTLSFYYVFSFIFQENNHVPHFILGFVSLVIAILCLTNRDRLTAKWIFSSVIFFAFTNLILSFIYIDTLNRILIFTGAQWLYLGLIIFSLIYWDKQLIS